MQPERSWPKFSILICGVGVFQLPGLHGEVSSLQRRNRRRNGHPSGFNDANNRQSVENQTYETPDYPV